VSARVEWLDVGGPAEPWAAAGLRLVDGHAHLFGTGLAFVGGDAGLRSWAISGIDDAVSDIDGVSTRVVAPEAPVLVEHPLGVIGIDHVVITTGSLERTCAAIADVTGAPLKRVRELGAMRQGFHRLGSLVVEVVERPDLADHAEAPATMWGLVLTVDDLDGAVARLGADRCGEARDAVQPGRRIATVSPGAELGLAVALMTP
jgi:hypothetical protein